MLLPRRNNCFHQCGFCAFILLQLLSLASLGSCASQFMPFKSAAFDAWDGSSTSMGGGGGGSGGAGGGSYVYKSTYARSEEVQRQCKSHLTDIAHDAAFQKQMETKKWAINNELSFLNGEWQEVPGKKPLIPSMSVNTNSSNGLVQKRGFPLVSFWVTDVDVPSGYSVHGNMVNVSAVLQVGMSSERALSYMSSGLQGFQVYPGFALLSVVMEGVYAELQSGERLLCMVGSSRLPLRGKNASQPWDWLDSVLSGSTFSPTLVEDSQLKAVLHFPKDLTLMSRAVSGRLESLHDTSDSLYFNPVDIYSQLGAYSNYQFLAGGTVNSACAKRDPHPGEVLRPRNVYQGNAFCTVVQELLTGQWVDVHPNWNCSSSNTTCIKFGPFVYPKEEEHLMDGGFNGSQLLVQDVRCVDFQEDDKSFSANMSAVIRAVLPSQNKNLAFERTNLDVLTLAAEGKWNSVSGELCMVGCRGGGKKPVCDTRICMFIPLTLSLRQRSILEGSISGIDSASEDFYPLSFHLAVYPLQLPSNVVGNMSYEYTKIKEAAALMDKDERSGVGEQIKKSLLEYPSADDNLLNLFEDLSLRSLAITNPNEAKGPHLKQYVELDIVAIQDHVRLNWVQSSSYNDTAASISSDDGAMTIEPDEAYKVAVQLKIKDNFGNKVVAVSAEGEYDPTVGKMYLMGCRQVSVPWQTLQENAELLEDGLDCMIEFKVEYPPTNARWLMNPTVALTITSIRTEDDPLFFTKIELETFPILYKRQREEIVSRKSLEGGLSMLTLSLILGCLISQLIYVKSHAESTPYISLLMLAVQCVGFSIPLITGVEALFARITSDGEDMRESVLNEGRWSHIIGYMVNLFTLATFLLTLRIAQKVYKARIRLLTRRPLEPWRVPNDKKVMAICFGVHVLGFIGVLIIHSIRISQRPVSSSMYMDWRGGLHKQYDWERILKEYYGLVQDLFLLPQVVGNHIWVVRGKPLRSLFYVGVTVLRLLPHVYDSLRPSVFNPYFADEFQYANPSSDFYSKAGDIAIPLLAVALAVVVYIQQRWNGLKWAKVLRQGSSKLMRMGSKMYERLPSKTFEAEMVEANGGEHMYDNGQVAVSTEN
eukprot:c36596_g1_i1 orf=399-3695(-)